MKLGVCYYPEHWPQAWWEADARAMAALGIVRVRIGEFAWSRIEPEPGRFDWAWLDQAIDVLHRHGREIVMCTPTATPPKWLVDSTPDMLAVDARGRERRFGSRRHYCFSSDTYLAQCVRITEAVAQRYGQHPGVVAWQTDNEYGCHDTTISYSPMAAKRFRLWLAARYGAIAALNEAWGTVFWSQEYRSFDEIDPPTLTVTEAHPAHRLDYNRFASDEVVRFNRVQTEILRQHSPGRDIVHNFMGFYTEFDHFAVARDLDVATWDSYPLGFLEQFWFSTAEKNRYLRQGHPDIAAFHHDLYRGVGRGRWQVMEQQPGPVNWAAHNPSPLPGMVRAWTWEAFAHGAEVVSYFRWRQAPFAQEQFHAGLHRPDRSEDVGAHEARQVTQDFARVGALAPCEKSSVALVFSYEADWLIDIQPQSRGYRALQLVFEWYTALRGLGLDVDIIAPEYDLSGYKLVLAPALPILSDDFVARAKASGALVLFGPRTGSRTPSLQIPDSLPPGPLQAELPMRVVRVDSLRPGAGPTVVLGDRSFEARLWREEIETDAETLASFGEGGPAWIRRGAFHYLATWPQAPLAENICATLALLAGLETQALAQGVRVRRRGGLTFAFNYNAEDCVTPSPPGADFVLGGPILGPAGVAAWRSM